MRPEQSRLPRRSNWSNPKTCNYFAAFFPFREWAYSDGGSAFGFNADDFAMLAAPSRPVLDRAGEQLTRLFQVLTRTDSRCASIVRPISTLPARHTAAASPW